MRIRTPADFGALIAAPGLPSTRSLWRKGLVSAGSRSSKWKKGKPRAEIGLVLRTLRALDIGLDAQKEGPGIPKAHTASHAADSYLDINSIVACARRKR